MSCSFDKNLLQTYLENTIEPLESIITEEHLKGCPHCRRELTELKLLLWELEEIPSIDLPTEAFHVKETVLMELKAHQTSSINHQPFSMKDLVEVQSNIAHNATLFLRLLPGSKVVVSASKASAKKASSLFGSFIKESLGVKPKGSLLRNSL